MLWKFMKYVINGNILRYHLFIIIKYNYIHCGTFDYRIIEAKTRENFNSGICRIVKELKDITLIL